jgi:predicted negative regulator of RcsB-dependent stress response
VTRAFLILAGTLAACGGADARWIEDGAQAHRRADEFVLQGAPDAALRVLAEFVARTPPSSLAAQDRRAVLQDTYARLAALAVETGKFDAALRDADAGIALGEGRDVFSSALHTLRGRAQEALGHQAQAVADYEAAQAIAESLLAEVLRDGGPR